MSRTLQKLIEEKVAQWRAQQPVMVPKENGPFVPPNVITLSNPVGTRGIEIGRRLGERLDIPVYGREIVQHIASSESLRVETVETLDEIAVGQLENYIGALLRERNFDQSEYVQALSRTITALWGHGTCVLIGRGAAHIVSRRYGLAVRLTASTDYRVHCYARQEGITEAEAARHVRRIDAQRAAFIQRFFGHQIDDPCNYDLVVNVQGFVIGRCVELITTAFHAKFGREPHTTPVSRPRRC